MNGATAEPDVKTTSPPTTTKQKMIGKSQNFFRSFMKDQSSKVNSSIGDLRACFNIAFSGG
jgi:hypothetical protein